MYASASSVYFRNPTDCCLLSDSDHKIQDLNSAALRALTCESCEHSRMRTETMLTYHSLNLPYRHDNKGVEPSTQVTEDPFTNFFDQYISQDSSSSSDNVNESYDFGGFDFGLDEDTAASSGYTTAQPLSGSGRSHARRLHSSSYSSFSPAYSSDPLLSRRHHRSLYFDKPSAAISGLELLNLEGKLPYQAPAAQSSSLASAPALPLRRKAKFTPETLRSRNQRIAKPAATTTSESPNMMRPLYYYRHETPSYQEWTQRFEQISLQTPTGNLPLSPPPSATFSNKGSTSSHQHHHRQQSFDQASKAAQAFAGTQRAIPSPLPSPSCFDQQHPVDYAAASHPASNHLRSPSWPHPITDVDDFDFTISPREVQPDWSQNMPESSGACYDNFSAAQSTPTLARNDSDFSSHGLIIDPYGQFTAEDASLDYLRTPMDPFPMAANDVHFPPPPKEESTIRASTPSSRASSACPSPPPPPSAKSPSKARQRFKTHRRKGSAPALRTAKSAGSLGFVNFTPHDSQKILTGVAPSGSSKTKARRDLEAHEKKRRLSLAVEKVVRDAGGDSEKLRLAGLL